MAKYLSFPILCIIFVFPLGLQAQTSLEGLDLLYSCGRYTSQNENEVHTTHFMRGFHLKKKELKFPEAVYYRHVDRALLKHIEKNCKLKKVKGSKDLRNLHRSFDTLCLSQCKRVQAKAVANLGILERKRRKSLKSLKKECPQLCQFAKKEHSQLLEEFNRTKPGTDQPVSIGK